MSRFEELVNLFTEAALKAVKTRSQKTGVAAMVFDNLKVGTNGSQIHDETETNCSQILPANERQVRPLMGEVKRPYLTPLEEKLLALIEQEYVDAWVRK